MTKKKRNQRKQKNSKKLLRLLGSRSEDDQSIQILFSPHLKKLWIKALRSGKFKRGSDVLCQLHPELLIPLYCPLGVLIEVLIQKGLPVKKSKRITTASSPTHNEPVLFHTYVYKNESSFCFLPKKLAKLIGISHEAQQEIGLLNDQPDNPHVGMRFKEVAQALEDGEICLDVEIEKEEIDSIQHHNYPA